MENDLLLLQFIGRCGKVNKSLYTFGGLFNLINDTWITVNQCKFDKDWNWLMLVVHKIENLKIGQFAKQLDREDIKPIEGNFWFNTDQTTVTIYANVYYWQTDNHINGLIQSFNSPSKFESTYNACVAFVKWYNKHKR